MIWQVSSLSIRTDYEYIADDWNTLPTHIHLCYTHNSRSTIIYDTQTSWCANALLKLMSLFSIHFIRNFKIYIKTYSFTYSIRLHNPYQYNVYVDLYIFKCWPCAVQKLWFILYFTLLNNMQRNPSKKKKYFYAPAESIHTHTHQHTSDMNRKQNMKNVNGVPFPTLT